MDFLVIRTPHCISFSILMKKIKMSYMLYTQRDWGEGTRKRKEEFERNEKRGGGERRGKYQQNDGQEKVK